MKKHVLSKKCWCKPDVISFRKDKEDILSDKVFEIASLFNDSMDNDKYNKIRNILKSIQMETEVETGLKNFQVTMKELADARRDDVEDFLRGFMTYINVGKPESSTFIKKVSKVLNEFLATLGEEEKLKEEKHGCCQCYCSRCREMCFRSRCVVHTEGEVEA